MKKIILPALLVGGLTLFSFTKSTDGGVKKIGENLYEVSANAKFSQDEKKQIVDLIAKEYNLSDTQLKKAETSGITLDNAKRSWIFSKKFSYEVIEEHFLFWGPKEETTTASKQFQQVSSILQKYSKM